MRLARATVTALVGLVLAGAVDCSRRDASDGSAASAGPSAAPPPFTLKTPVVTPPAIAIHNLEAEIVDREKKAAAGDSEARIQLVPRYLSRAQFLGRVSDLAAADMASAAAVAAAPKDARAHLCRASALGAVHEFAAEAAEIDQAAALGAEPQEITAARVPLLLAVGREDEAVALEPQSDALLPAALVIRASVESRLGHDAEADRLFDLARSKYRDNTPFGVGWMDFEHARALEHAGDRARARAYLEEAVKVLPTYAHAASHLASMLPPERALPMLQELDKTSDDPDVVAALADALRRAGRSDEAKAAADRARARFEELLARFPKAFADHAANFFLGMGGDPARALGLAKANADNRPTDEAVELWLTAAQAAASHAETCAAAARVKALAHAPASLRQRAEEAVKACP